MPKVSTDDMARRLQSVYLGPPSMRWPDMRFQAIGFFAAVELALLWMVVLLRPDGTPVGIVAAMVSPLVALLITRKVMAHVDYDRPIRWMLTTLINEVTAPRPLPRTPTTTAVTPRRGFTLPEGHDR